MNLADAKARLTVFDLWIRFGFEGDPSKSCRCPFHLDRTPSLSIRRDGGLFHCFAGCGGGDAVDFFRLASGLPHAEACRKFIEMAAGGSSALLTAVSRQQEHSKVLDKVRLRKLWPAFETVKEGEDDLNWRLLLRLASLRHVSKEGAMLMAERGLLWFAPWKKVPAWIVTDGARVSAQARRIDGKLWPEIERKAQFLPGSQGVWPIGVREAEPFPSILLCEGGPDALAGHHFLVAHGLQADCAVVGILGAANSIPADALPLFARKRVRIMAHADDEGREAAWKWTRLLEGAGATTDAVDFAGLLRTDGQPVMDLNDCTQIRAEDMHNLDDLIPSP